MAGQITHIIAGERALREAAPEEGEELLREQGPAFRLGCQGPDIFYHNQRTKPSGLHYGALAHRRGYGRLVAGALASLPPEPSPARRQAEAYILGLATHAALDRATHPFIVYFSGWHDPAIPGSERYRSCHPFLERLLDVGYLAASLGLPPAAFDIAAKLGLETGSTPESLGLPKDRAGEALIVALWSSGLRSAFPRSTGSDFLLEKRVENALLDGRHFYGITNPAVTALNPERKDWFGYLDDRAGPRSVCLVYPDSLPEGLDVLNLGKAAWEEPSGLGTERDESYLELVEKGIHTAAVALGALLPALATEGPPGFELAAAIGDGGLSIVDAEGRSVGPRVCRPLPLMEIMELEYGRRLEWAKRQLGKA
ncbi:MAG TPA: zinc dependent phospholipase C family protein [Rectinemataceae bacterium]|nr:zinc dependent phospholipase C family protein [Rectinemataceae bacterium]